MPAKDVGTLVFKLSLCAIVLAIEVRFSCLFSANEIDIHVICQFSHLRDYCFILYKNTEFAKRRVFAAKGKKIKGELLIWYPDQVHEFNDKAN
jgi:hypothetical protein